MRLTNYSDYALRSLIYLAVQKEGQTLVNISDIAGSYDISKSHLTKIIHKLGQLGYIESVRGKNGGIRLARAPDDINLGVLIKQIEPDFELVECFAVPISDDSQQYDNSQQPDDPQKADQLRAAIPLIEAGADNKKQGCAISPVCRLKGVFFEALTAFVSVLEGYTLADIINNKDDLRRLLH